MPFWLFDAGAGRTYPLGPACAAGATQTLIIRKPAFSVTRGGTIAFADVPVMALYKMTDELLSPSNPSTCLKRWISDGLSGGISG